jgi:DNA polymerase-3 subunit alpha
MICSGDTEGVFQIEHISDDLLEQAMPSSLEELSALIALDRPGLEEFLRAYIEAKRNPETVTYRTPELEPILKETCGIIVYQEQVMEILHTLAGYSMARADLARRAIAKRMPEGLKLQREIFVYGGNGWDGLPACDGCLKRGIDEDTANAVFDDIEKYCHYTFNKAHAISYALLSYQTAYLKCHYPEEFAAAFKKNDDGSIV